MQCPKCQGTMELIVEPEASAHRCTRCKGLWFDMMAHETLKHRAEEIDTGDPAQGEECNKMDRIKCPVCIGHWELIRMVDPQQPHIWFESCKNCYGRFYDAGEYQDFAEIEFADLIKDWNAPERL